MFGLDLFIFLNQGFKEFPRTITQNDQRNLKIISSLKIWSYPEDALKINVKHVGFSNQMSEMYP